MLKPLRDEVFVEIEEAEKRKSGIILIGGTGGTHTGIVKAVGPGFENPNGVIEKVPLEPGDKVFFPKGTGMSIEHERNEFLMLKFGDIMGIVEED
jgi:co-chaperonin GroES (HSP10)